MRLELELIERILLRGRAGNRWLGETPVQPEVWRRYARADADAFIDLLIAPLENRQSSSLAQELLARIAAVMRPSPTGELRLTPIEGFVAVRLPLPIFARAVLPAAGIDVAGIVRELETFAGLSGEEGARELRLSDLARLSGRHGRALSPAQRTLVLLLIMLTEGSEEITEEELVHLESRSSTLDRPVNVSWVRGVVSPRRSIWQISANRRVEALSVSTETVKADAARRVFETSCRDITWAVIDSGIDGSHPAFLDHEAGGFKIRIDKALDFSRMRTLASYDALLTGPGAFNIPELAEKARLSPENMQAFLGRLAEDARFGRPFDWNVLERLLECSPDQLDVTDGSDRPIGHGTHVAGVLGGDWREGESVVHQGVCPDIRLYDLRVLGENSVDTEFAVIAALEYIRWLNQKNRYLKIHGVNLSIGMQHDLKNFACGQTPVCRAAHATVRAGVVVVAAAGNWGSQEFLTSGGSTYQGYAPVSIADPGNTESVITVGSTHRERPHEYGVSFFSSRGPTGDGRAKPDLVAPGERIDGPLPNLGYGRLDGTSMAAPHVSGVAALLLARHSEFIGKPDEVKRVLVSTATDLGRERHFQGAGLVDALRALQSL